MNNFIKGGMLAMGLIEVELLIVILLLWNVMKYLQFLHKDSKEKNEQNRKVIELLERQIENK